MFDLIELNKTLLPHLGDDKARQDESRQWHFVNP